MLQLVLLEEDLGVDSAAGGALGRLVGLDELQLGVGQGLLGDLGLRKNKAGFWLVTRSSVLPPSTQLAPGCLLLQ